MKEGKEIYKKDELGIREGNEIFKKGELRMKEGMEIQWPSMKMSRK